MDNNKRESTGQQDDGQGEDGGWPQGAPPEVDDLTPIGQIVDMPPEVTPVADIEPEGLGFDPFATGQCPDGNGPAGLGLPDPA